MNAGTKRPPSPRIPPAKRAKASQACLSCRKHKTRCEMLDGDNSGAQCHRCKVLSLSCSFEDGSGPSPTPSSARVLQPEIQAQSSIDRRSSLPPSKKPQDVLMDDTRRPAKVWGDTSPDAHSQFRTQSSDEEELDLMHTEHLLPKKHSPWGLLKLGDFESNMVPTLVIQALTRDGKSTADSSRHKVDQALLHLLGREQIKYLVGIFEDRYSPWLNLQPSNRNDGALLRLAQCCVASRHLDPSIRSIVTPQLYRLADELIFKQSFNPLPSTDAIHAILVLSLWEPIGDAASREPRDGRLIAVTAVSMAMNLRLSEAMVYAQTLRKEKKPNEPLGAELAEALDKARLWFSLTMVESMLCVGSGREPISNCESLICEVLETTSPAPLNISGTRDLRLSLFCQLIATTQQGLSIKLRSVDELGVFYKEVLGIFVHMDVLERLITPLPVLAEHEAFYFRMLHLYYQSCRLLVCIHALVAIKIAHSKSDSESPWFLLAEHNGVNLAESWGHQALVFSEAILIATISLPEAELLSAVPDHMFSMITFATLFVMMSKWSVLEHTGQQMPGYSDPILARTIERLLTIAWSPDHFAAKCARLIERGVTSFRKRVEKSTTELKEYPKPIVKHFSTSTRAEVGPSSGSRSGSVSSGMGTGVYGADSPATGGPAGVNLGFTLMDTQHIFSNFPMNDSNYCMATDIFLDNDFWSSFMLNSTDGHGPSVMGV